LKVVGHQLVDLLLDDGPLKGVLGRRDLLLQEVPIHAARRLVLAAGGLAAGAEGEDLETDQGLQVGARKQGFVKAYPQLVQAKRGDRDHGHLLARGSLRSRVAGRAAKAYTAGRGI